MCDGGSVCVQWHSPILCVCVCVCTQDGNTALMMAAFEGRAGEVERLIQGGAPVNAQNKVRFVVGVCCGLWFVQ